MDWTSDRLALSCGYVGGFLVTGGSPNATLVMHRDRPPGSFNGATPVKAWKRLRLPNCQRVYIEISLRASLYYVAARIRWSRRFAGSGCSPMRVWSYSLRPVAIYAAVDAVCPLQVNCQYPLALGGRVTFQQSQSREYHGSNVP
jgi:hypothetical protein